MAKRVLIGLATVSLALVCLAVPASQVPQKETYRAEFMRRKLEHSKLILEGLTREDYPKITRAANALKAISQAADWAEVDLPDPKQYERYSMEFQRLADRLAAKAESRSLDGATLTFTQLTVNCVDCHTHVRTAKKK